MTVTHVPATTRAEELHEILLSDGALVARSRSSHALVRHPLILDVAGRLLDRAQSYQLHLTQVI